VVRTNSVTVRRLAAGTLLAVLALFAALAQGGQSPQTDLQTASQKARAATVLVESSLPNPLRPGEDMPVTNTGFFVSGEGHVLTSVFAVSGGSPLRVHRSDGGTSDAKVRALDQRSGLALLETTFKDAVCLVPASDAPATGEWLVAANAVACPEQKMRVGLRPGLSSGSKASVKLSGVKWEGLLVCDIPACSGGAVGPILDVRGDLTGLVLGVRSLADGSECSYVLPSGDLAPILKDLMAGKTRRLGWLGVSVARTGEQEGLTVQAVLGGSPGFQAGIRPGDVLLQIGEEAITEPAVFESQVVEASPGTQLDVKLLRDRQVRTTQVKVGARPFLISRVPVAGTRDVRFVQRRLLTVVPDPAARVAQEKLIENLAAQNRELREQVQRLEKRLQALESDAKAPE